MKLLEVFLQKVESRFEQILEIGNDQQLFISSYLQGHLDLMVSELYKEKRDSLELCDSLMRKSLKVAFDNNELSSQDQQQVLALWEELISE